MNTDLRQDLSQTIQGIHARFWATGTGGNFSVVSQREPLRLLMAPSGVDKGSVQPAHLIEVDNQGRVVAGQGRVSAETQLHLQIVQRVKAGAVLHTHSIFNTLLSEYYQSNQSLTLIGYEMLKGLEGIQTHQGAITLPILANSQDIVALSQMVGVILSEKPDTYGILLAGHGLYTWGKTLFEARRHLEILEFLLELTYRKLTLPPL
ncbi:MAG: methylthioribulose 1-phosphate dehydratase [Aphanizomenon sp.]|jgi:methylthioribulose-1-phosphate dehydratase